MENFQTAECRERYSVNSVRAHTITQQSHPGSYAKCSLPPLREQVLYSYDKFLADLGAKLRQMRLERGWTYRYMIVKHGFHLAHWQSFEKGKGISVPSLLRVCEVFGIPLESLVAGLGVAVEQAKPLDAVDQDRDPSQNATTRQSTKASPSQIPSVSPPRRPRSPRRKPS